MQIHVREQIRTEQALHRAIDANELHVFYQPIIEIPTRSIIGYEALSRWRSSTLGDIPPSHFITRVEETGLIVPIGHWVLDEVARQWSNFQSRGSVAPALAVNISGVQLRVDSIDLMRRVVSVAKALPGALWLEITESTLFEGPIGARETLEELKALGVRLVIDDFGTGYSSLSQLRMLPVDAIKIDRVFVDRIDDGPRDRAFVRVIIELAHALGIVAIAEGVETQSQFDALQEMSCDQVQGFLFSPAVSFEELSTHFEK